MHFSRKLSVGTARGAAPQLYYDGATTSATTVLDPRNKV